MSSSIGEIWANREDYISRARQNTEFLNRRSVTLNENAAKVALWQKFGLANRAPRLILRALHEIVSHKTQRGSYLANALLWEVEGSDEEMAKVQIELKCADEQLTLINSALTIERGEGVDPNRPRVMENTENKQLKELVDAKRKAEEQVQQAAQQAQQAAIRERIEKAQGVEQKNGMLVAALVGTLAAQFFAAPLVATLTCAAIAATVIYIGYESGYMPYYGEVASSSS